MNVIILGAGQVGASVAEHLASEENDITMIDVDASRLAEVANRVELRTLVGNAASPSLLEQAGARDCDLLVAVTQSDQTNLCASLIAKRLFNVPRSIVRVRAADYTAYRELFAADAFAVDLAICPEQIVCDAVSRLVDHPGVLQLLDFTGGAVQLAAVRAEQGGALVGHPIRALRDHLPSVAMRVAAIYRRGEPILPEGDTVIESGDEVFFLAPAGKIELLLQELRPVERRGRRVMIAGGGNIGQRLANMLEQGYEVKVIERDGKRAERLAAVLESALVLVGDATDERLLEREGIEETDYFLAVTNDDENNIMSAALAKRLGARKTLALINRSAYVDLVQGETVDVAISPALVTIGTLLKHVRQGDVAAVHRLRRGAAEAIEIIAHGDSHHSKVVGRRIDAIAWPKGVSVGALVRPASNPEHLPQVLMAHHDTVIEEGDHVILFCTERRQVRAVERLFAVGFGFF
ncbi:MAG: Trk system potassium transporter TrkA [Hydrogenophilus sp.]|nr:Trk system potassium transporter TrkA [Hydrogenophilus sp.]